MYSSNQPRKASLTLLCSQPLAGICTSFKKKKPQLPPLSRSLGSLDVPFQLSMERRSDHYVARKYSETDASFFTLALPVDRVWPLVALSACQRHLGQGPAVRLCPQRDVNGDGDGGHVSLRPVYLSGWLRRGWLEVGETLALRDGDRLCRLPLDRADLH